MGARVAWWKKFQPRGGPVGESGATGLVPKTREGVWVIGCASPIMPLMGMLNYKDKLFDK